MKPQLLNDWHVHVTTRLSVSVSAMITPVAMWLKIRKMFMRVQCVGSLMVSDNVSNIMPEMLIRLPLFLITYVSFIFQRITSNSNLNNQSTDQ